MSHILSLRFALIALSILALAAEASEAATKRKASGAQNQSSGKSTSTQSGSRRPADPNSGTRDRYDPVGKD
jgi:hypothetical protein